MEIFEALFWKFRLFIISVPHNWQLLHFCLMRISFLCVHILNFNIESENCNTS